jgi:hypothetical protein
MRLGLPSLDYMNPSAEPIEYNCQNRPFSPKADAITTRRRIQPVWNTQILPHNSQGGHVVIKMEPIQP